MQTVSLTVQVPAGSEALASGIEKLVVACVKNHQSKLGVAFEISADVEAAVADLGPALSQVGLVGTEAKADPLGVAEALSIGVIEAAKSLLSSPSAAAS